MTGASPELSMTVLGTDGSYPGPGGCNSGYLLRAGGFATWMDTGPGTMANLQLHIPLASLDAVVVSHAHPDHWSDLEGLYVAMRYFLGRQGLPIYAPAEIRDLMVGEKPDGTFDWRAIGDGETAQVGPARWTWSQTDHPVETLASRVDVGGRTLAYSADTGPGWELSKLGEGIHLALVEATMASEQEGTLQHLSARQAGQTAARAGAERLLLTHFAPPIDREVARAEATAAFGKPVDLAVVGKTWGI
jgi:ribonuclease BN (tRNA processing enzyme)